MNQPTSFVDTQQVRRNFARAAAGYDDVAVISREVGSRMLERLDYVRIEPQRVLDLGCGTGASLTALGERYPEAQLLGADFCVDMLGAGNRQRSRVRWMLPFLKARKARLLAADAQALPFASNSVDLLWSNQMLHWLDDPLPALREMQRTLAVGGLLMFSTLGPDTLKELRASFADDGVHTQRFIDMHDYGDMLLASGFSDPVMDVEVLTLTYAAFDDLMRDLRHSGAACAMVDRRRGLTGRSVWQAARAAYEQRRHEGRLPATFEIVYGHAWKSAPPPKNTTADGAAIVRFDPKQRLR